jgi:hypothetical protein
MLYDTAHGFVTCTLNLQITGETVNGFVKGIPNYYIIYKTMKSFSQCMLNLLISYETFDRFVFRYTELLVVPLNYQWFRKTSKGSAYIVRNCS